MENIVTITLMTLTLFGKIEYHTFEIPDTRWQYHGDGVMSKSESNSAVCSSWYHYNIVIDKNPKYKPFTNQNIYRHRYKGKKVIKRYLWSHFKDSKEVDMFSDMENRHFFHNAISFFKKETLIDRPFNEVLVGKEDRYWANKMIKRKMK